MRAMMLGVCLGAVWGCGWGAGASNEAAETFEEPRFVSLSPAISETLGALGALDQLVGRSDWCAQPEAVVALPSFGSALTPHLEGLVQVQPATMLVDGSAGADLDVLRKVGPVEVLPWLTREEVLGSVRRLGAVLDRAPEARQLAEKLGAGLSDVPPSQPDAPRVLLVLGTQGPEAGEIWYVKRNSLHGAALHAAGGRHAIDRDVEGAPTLSLEALLALDPPVIVTLSPQPVDEETVRESWAGLTPLSAVQHDRVVVIAGPHALSTGPSILELVQDLRGVLDKTRSAP
jgi:iron complex transport system substrate-binding protein